MYCAGTGVRNGPIARPEETYRVCVHAPISLSVIRCNDKSLHLHRIGIRVQTEKEIIYS
jgi:hypothetical protein